MTLKGAKCRVILFNSENIDYKATAERYGFRLVGTYKMIRIRPK